MGWFKFFGGVLILFTILGFVSAVIDAKKKQEETKKFLDETDKLSEDLNKIGADIEKIEGNSGDTTKSDK